MTDLLPPCVADPVSYDVDPVSGVPHTPVNQLVQACLTRCPVYADCARLPHVDVYGVVAGQYRPWPPEPPDYVRGSPALRQAIQHILSILPATTPGARLPSQRDLSAACGVSRPIVIRALEILSENGVIAQTLPPDCQRFQYHALPSSAVACHNDPADAGSAA